MSVSAQRAGGERRQRDEQETCIGPHPSRRFLESLAALWRARGSVAAFAERDVRVKYKQAALGVLWVVIQPLGYVLVFTFAFRHAGRLPGGGAPYAAFVLSTLVPWLFLQTAVAFAANALVNDADLMRKTYFPREVPIIAAVLAGVVDLAFALVVFALIGPILGAHVSGWWLLAPVLVVPLALLATAVSLPLAALNVYYRDFRYALPFALQLWLFASPVAYPLTAVPAEWQTVYAALNPAAGILDAFRRVLALGALPDAQVLSVSIAASLVLAFAGYELFKFLEPRFADVA